jgi:hypothetical protein
MVRGGRGICVARRWLFCGTRRGTGTCRPAGVRVRRTRRPRRPSARRGEPSSITRPACSTRTRVRRHLRARTAAGTPSTTLNRSMAACLVAHRYAQAVPGEDKRRREGSGGEAARTLFSQPGPAEGDEVYRCYRPPSRIFCRRSLPMPLENPIWPVTPRVHENQASRVCSLIRPSGTGRTGGQRGACGRWLRRSGW